MECHLYYLIRRGFGPHLMRLNPSVLSAADAPPLMPTYSSWSSMARKFYARRITPCSLRWLTLSTSWLSTRATLPPFQLRTSANVRSMDFPPRSFPFRQRQKRDLKVCALLYYILSRTGVLKVSRCSLRTHV